MHYSPRPGRNPPRAVSLAQPRLNLSLALVFRLLLPAADELVARHGERRHVLARGEAAHLRVAREAPREEDLVHGPISFPVGRLRRSRPCVSGGMTRSTYRSGVDWHVSGDARPVTRDGTRYLHGADPGRSVLLPRSTGSQGRMKAGRRRDVHALLPSRTDQR